MIIMSENVITQIINLKKDNDKLLKLLEELKFNYEERIQNLEIQMKKLNIKKDSYNNVHICGYNRTRNRGTCKRLCKGDGCSYHKKD